jgi:hypothetical protein
MPWKLPYITTWDDSRNQNHPTDSAEEAVLEKELVVLCYLFSASRRRRVELVAAPYAAVALGYQWVITL